MISKTLSRSPEVMLLFDLLILAAAAAFWGAYFNFSDYAEITAAVLVPITGLIVLFLKGNYKIREFNITFWNAYRLFEGVIFAHIPPALLLFFFVSGKELLPFLCFDILTVFSLLYLYRLGFHFYLFHIKAEKNILILGTNKRAKILADEIQAKKALRMKIAGFVQMNNSEENFISDKELPVYRNVTNLENIIKENDISIAAAAESSELILTIPRHVMIYKMPDFYEMALEKYYIDEETITELYYQFAANNSLLYDFFKRIYDIAAAWIILIVTLPVTGLTALGVWLTDRENPIYTQTRIGRDGREFKCYKLRTMRTNNYVPENLKNGGYAANQEQDDRVIKWCKFVRKARFDEIPQMINIIKGDMSITGPRAEWSEVVKIYKEQIPYYSCRMRVKTGWTGWAQINQGHLFSLDDEAEKLAYDLYYIKHRNVLWEICILIKAVFLALGGRHA